MTDRTEHTPTAQPRPAVRDREGTVMLLHEALARSRQREAEQAAREHALARHLSAGRLWDRLAGFAARRAVRARANAGRTPLDRVVVDGLKGAV
jgi:putative heme iron utilization protein